MAFKMTRQQRRKIAGHCFDAINYYLACNDSITRIEQELNVTFSSDVINMLIQVSNEGYGEKGIDGVEERLDEVLEILSEDMIEDEEDDDHE